MLRFVVIIAMLFLISIRSGAAADPVSQGGQGSAAATDSKKYPAIVLYSVAWCPHCREAKTYLTSHNIPFVNRDVEMDAAAMDDLNNKYESGGVPVIVLGEGKNEVVLRGFSPESFQEKLKLFPSGR